MKLYNVPENSPVGRLVSEIETACACAGNLTLSRWQYNSQRGRDIVINWAVHQGPRADQYRHQRDILAHERLTSLEGKTERSEAFRALVRILETMTNEKTFAK